MLHVLVLNPFNHPRRDASYDRVVGDIVGDDGTGTDDATRTDKKHFYYPFTKNSPSSNTSVLSCLT